MLAASLYCMTHIQLATSGWQHPPLSGYALCLSANDGRDPVSVLEVAKLNLTFGLLCCDPCSVAPR